MKPRILVTRHVYPEAISILAALGEVQYNDSSTGLGADGLAEAAADKHAIVSQLTDTIDARIMDAAPDLKVIANVAVGYNNIDAPACAANRTAE